MWFEARGHRLVPSSPRRPHFQQRRLQVVARHHRLAAADGRTSESVRRSRAHEAGELGARKVLGGLREGGRGFGRIERARGAIGVDVALGVLAQRAIGTHRARVNAQDVTPPLDVGQRDLELHLEPPRTQQRLVKQLGPVGQPDAPGPARRKRMDEK